MRALLVALVLPLAAAEVQAAGARTIPPNLGLVLEAAALYDRPSGKPFTSALAKGETVLALQRGTERFLQETATTRKETDDNEASGAFWYRVRRQSGAEGWVFGQHLALYVTGDLFGVRYQDSPPGNRPELPIDRTLDLNGNGQAETVWLAAVDWRGGYEEYDDSTHPCVVVSDEPGRVLGWEGTSADAAAHVLLPNELRVFDVTGDGSPEILVRATEVVSEVGEVGQRVSIYQVTHRQLRRIFLGEVSSDNPTPFGYHPARMTIRVGHIMVEDLPPDVDQAMPCWGRPLMPLGDRCLRKDETRWQWNGSRQVFELEAKKEQLPVVAQTLHPTDLHGTREPGSSTTAHLKAQAAVQVQQVAGGIELDEKAANDLRLLVRAPNGATGWLSAKDLLFQDEFLRPYLKGDEKGARNRPLIVW